MRRCVMDERTEELLRKLQTLAKVYGDLARDKRDAYERTRDRIHQAHADAYHGICADLEEVIGKFG